MIASSEQSELINSGINEFEFQPPQEQKNGKKSSDSFPKIPLVTLALIAGAIYWKYKTSI